MNASARWLFGPASDLWLGCGGAYAAIFALLCFAPEGVQRAIPLGLLPLVVLVTGIPHYGATLLRVYERAADRDAYRFFTIWASAAIYLWFVFGVYGLGVGSWLVTLYLTWSPWHYTGQNYGIAVMFLRRRGVPMTEGTKRWLYASFISSYLLVFVGLHGLGAGYNVDGYPGSTYRFLPLGIPAALQLPLIAGGALVHVVASALAFARLARGGHGRELAPVLAIAGLQALWFTLPTLAVASGLFGPDSGFGLALETYGLLWIAVAHGVQYLWVTTYYAGNGERAERRAPYLAKALLAGAAIWGVPTLLFAPDLLGVHSYDTGLALLVAAAVNVHHFVLDGAIWKLRDGRVARILLAPRDSEASARPEPTPGHSVWPGLARAAVALAGLTYVAVTIVGTLEVEFGVRRATEVDRMRSAAERLRWVGRDHPDLRYDLGAESLHANDLENARRDFERSLELRDSARARIGLGLVEVREERWPEALRAFDAALALDPDDLRALTRSAQVLMRLGEREAARERLERAQQIAPEREVLRDWLERVRAPDEA